MTKNVTSFDVARLAGVSQPTVSRILRNLPGASPATRSRVLNAAAELSYIPSESGRALSTRRSRRVAVVAEELTNPYYPELVEPIRRSLRSHDLRAVLISDAEPGGVGVEILADGSYDGVILTTTLRSSSLPRDLTERGVPHVLVNRVLDIAESPSCAVDNVGGATAISALVADLGHRLVGSIQGPAVTSTGRERARAVSRELRSRGVPLRRTMIRRTAFGHDTGRAAAIDLLTQASRPTAIVCGNDVIALGALSAARQLKIAVPEELTVVGFDDIPMAGWPLINLTTVHCELEKLAATAVDLLLAEISGPQRPALLRLLPVSLVLRGTHAPPG